MKQTSVKSFHRSTREHGDLSIQKQSVTYIRYSKDGQSNNSIERQESITNYWHACNNVFNIETCTDEGYSARTFDRPDVKKLFEFISKNHRNIDFLVVSDLTRFSRDLGEAITLVKKFSLLITLKLLVLTGMLFMM